jgi:hypothetical protein
MYHLNIITSQLAGWLGREADRSLTAKAEFNIWSYTSTTPYVFMIWWYLVKHTDNFASMRRLACLSSAFI